jgi:menaquinone-dependent protoporphyrinogen oxidase
LDVAVSAKTQRRLGALGARDHHLFRAALDPKRLNILERAAIKAAKSPIGDFRDWGDIEGWADSIADR